MRRHGHDGARAVGDENVVGDPDGDLLAVDGIDGVGAGEDAGLVLGQVGPVEVRLQGRFLAVGLDCGLLLGSGDLLDQRMLGSEDHIRAAEESVGARGVDSDLFAGFSCEIDVGALGLADPVSLHHLDRFRPVDQIEVFQKSFRVSRDLKVPLLHRHLDDREAAHFGFAVHDFLVGQHGLQLGAPVDGLLSLVGQAHFVKLQKDPLRPLVVIGVGGVDLAVPVVGEAQSLDLLPEAVDVLVRALPRVRSRFDGVVLRRQSEGVPAHGVQNVEALHAFEAAVYVGRGVALGVSDVQSGAGRIREHVQNVNGLSSLVAVDGRVGFFLFPHFLPLRLYACRIVIRDLFHFALSYLKRASHSARSSLYVSKSWASMIFLPAVWQSLSLVFKSALLRTDWASAGMESESTPKPR